LLSEPTSRLTVFTGFANTGIFGKWPGIVCCGAPNLFAILLKEGMLIPKTTLKNVGIGFLMVLIYVFFTTSHFMSQEQV